VTSIREQFRASPAGLSSVVIRMQAPADAAQAVSVKSIAALVFVTLVAGATAAGDGAPSWVQHGQLTPQARQLVGVMRRVEDFGLAAEDFSGSLAEIDSLAGEPANSALLDERVGDATLRLVNQLHHGRVDPRAAAYELSRRRAPLDAGAALQLLAHSGNALELLATFEPRSRQYRALKQALARYRGVRTDLASLPPPAASAIRAGDSYDGAAKLRWLLAEFGDAPAPRDDAGAETSYDAELAAAVACFQSRHGLIADGVLGPRTFAALSVPITQRIRQIELTLERWRWLPDIDPPAVIVNVPQYVLYALPDPRDASAGALPFKTPVIVGQTAKQTPIFDSSIEAVIFRPYWNVPRSIVDEELLPLIAADPGYLARHDMEIVRGDGDDAAVLPPGAASVAALRAGGARLRQRPGRANALGLIKFDLPNAHSVYLHSTPEAQLFARERRTLSHGCIRVSDASALAAYLLKDTPGDWSADAVEAATCGEATFTVRLATPVPVFVLYGTVVVDTDGAILFFEDVYGHDRTLDTLLRAGRSAERTAGSG
jgi:murein L,D-transpeptidase YcbB/YkuD